MSGKPLVSIVVPLFNKESTVKRTLLSILSQEYQNLEIIVVDDGSTDNSLHIVEQIAHIDDRIKIITQINAGPGAARNRGLAAATGALISFLDADDEYEPLFLDIGVKCLTNNEEIQIFSSSHYRTVAGLKKDFTAYFKAFGLEGGPFKVTSNYSVYRLLGLVWFHHSSVVLCRTEVVRRYGGFYDEKRSIYGEDSYLWITIILNEKGYCEMTPLGWYHTEDSSLCGGGGGKEMAAFLSAPERLRLHCPHDLRVLLEDLFGLFAVSFILGSIAKSARQIEALIRNFDGFHRAEHSREIIDFLTMAGQYFGGVNNGVLAKLEAGPDEGAPWS